MVVRLALLIAVAAFAACACKGDKNEPRIQLSLTRPLLLGEVPPYLEPEPEIFQIGGTLYITYKPVDATGPSLFLQEFEAPELAGFPQRPNFDDPEFNDALEDTPFDSHFAAWRCGELGLSTLIQWETGEPSPDRTAILDELTDLLEEACANPSSVPTPAIEIEDVENPQVPTCTPSERDSILEVHVKNEGSESVFADVWAVDDAQLVDTVEISAGETGTITLDLREFSGGFELRMDSDPDESPGFGYTPADESPRMRDESFIVSGPPLRVLPQDIEFTERNCL